MCMGEGECACGIVYLYVCIYRFKITEKGNKKKGEKSKENKIKCLRGEKEKYRR